MGNQMACLPRRLRKSGKTSRVKLQSRKNFRLEEELLHQQALALMLHQRHSQSARFDPSISQRNLEMHLKQGLSRSASARPRSVTDPVVHPPQLFKGIKDASLSMKLETKNFVLVHGGGFGAWCWYKSIALLEEAGFVTTALDLTGSGINSTNLKDITCLEHYVKPLVDFLEKVPDHEKVILVGHSFGGACITYAMERFPGKIAKAIFVAATMVANERRAFDVFAEEVLTSDDPIRSAQIFLYANGSECPPTALDFERSLVKELFFNQSPAKDIALATVALRPTPFGPVSEKLVLTKENYGSIRRFFIQTLDDHALTTPIQEHIIKLNPPEQVFKLKGSDHCPFFSKPQSLHKLFMEIAQIEAKEEIL